MHLQTRARRKRAEKRITAFFSPLGINKEERIYIYKESRVGEDDYVCLLPLWRSHATRLANARGGDREREKTKPRLQKESLPIGEGREFTGVMCCGVYEVSRKMTGA